MLREEGLLTNARVEDAGVPPVAATRSRNGSVWVFSVGKAKSAAPV
jgi:hypothetical protein